MANWDDARFVLALARTGSIRAAAKSLAVNHTTVSRRISALESRLSARLFEQTPSGYVLTASGKIISKAAESMEDILVGSERRIEGSDIELTGEVHIHIPDIFEAWVCEKLALFSSQHPRLYIHLTCMTAMADLAKREADIALRFSQSPPENMVGRKVAVMPAAIYANVDLEIDPKKEWSDYSWIRWAEPYRNSPIELVAEKILPASSASIIVTTYHSSTNLIRNGAGIGFLSPWFADNDPKLKRISPVMKEADLDIWVLIHPDLRGVKRIKAITDLLADIFVSKSN